MRPNVEGVRGGGGVREGVSPPLVEGVIGASTGKFLEFRMQESASEPIFQ